MGSWLTLHGIPLVIGLATGAALCYLLAVVRSRRQVGDPVRAEQERQSREAILHGLAKAARLLFNTSDKEAVMTSALAVLGKAVGVDRVYVFENHVHPQTGQLLASQRFEWCGPGIKPEIDNEAMQNMAYDEVIPNWRPILESGEAVHGLVNELKPAERELLKPQNIVSIVVVPIFIDGHFWGQIGFDDCTRSREWSQVEIDVLEVAAGTIGGAIRGMQFEEELKRLVSTDSLTGVSSRRAFLKQAHACFEKAQAGTGSMALLIMDMDHFKTINDNHGHPVGDEALKLFAKTCRHTFRDDDLIGRTGGEEFAVVLHDVDAEQARMLAERLRQQVEDLALPIESEKLSLSVSIGMATPKPGDNDFGQLLKRADDALYTAKRGGRNQVRLAGQAA